MKKILFTFFFCFFLSFLYGQHNITFPSITCEGLNEEHVILPQAIKGKYTIIGIAYSKKSEEYLKTWFMPIFYEYLYTAHHPVLFHKDHHVNVFFLPMFTGTHEISLHSARLYFKKNIDTKLHRHILVYRGNLQKYQEILDFEHVDQPYIFVLDKEGRIICEIIGEYSSLKMQKLEQYILD